MSRDIEKRRASQRRAMARYYERNPDAQIRRNQERKCKIKQWFAEYKSQLACEVCGENHPACIDFHHINPAEKKYNVFKMVDLGLSIDSIRRELSKCKVLCSNCHRKAHWNDRGAHSN